jgi:hypothetical protein
LVNINGDSLQAVYAKHSAIANAASGSGTKAVQNISTNNGCTTCN